MENERYCIICGELPPVLEIPMTVEQWKFDNPFEPGVVSHIRMSPMTAAQWDSLFHGLPEGCYAAPPEPGLPAGAQIDGHCRHCQRRMCARHWVHAVVFDNGYYDGMDAICPYGHRFADVAR